MALHMQHKNSSKVLRKLRAAYYSNIIRMDMIMQVIIELLFNSNCQLICTCMRLKVYVAFWVRVAQTLALLSIKV